MQTKTKILLWMCVAMILGYLPWYNFSAVLAYISAEFNLTSTDTGMIISAFQLGYVIVVIITGWLADKIGPKKVVMYATLFAGIFSTAFVFVAKDFWTILIMRLLTGCAAGAIYAPGMSLISDWFPPNERGGALGAYTGALTAASAGGYFVAAPIAASAGWRVGMLATSIPAFIAFFIVLFLVEDRPASDIQFDGAPTGLNSLKPAPEGGYTGPVLITAGYMGHMWELYAFWPWVGPYLVAAAIHTGAMSVDAAVKWGGLMAALITVMGAASVWLLGIVADKIGRTKAILIGSICSLIPEFFFGYLINTSLTLVVLVGLWIGFWVISDSAIYKAGLTDMVSPKIRGTALGVQSAVGYSMTIISPLVFGMVLQAYNPGVSSTAATVWGPSFAILGLGAIAAPVMALILRRIPQAKLMTGGKM